MTQIDKAEALAPCPFCGGEAEWKSGGPGCAWISCKSCPAETGDGSIPRIAAAWNRRAALPARGVGVKPLVWEPSAINKPWHSAKAPWGWYYAQWDDETQAWFASLEMGEVEAPIIMSPSDVPTIEAAKAAAQADYEARILAALEPAAHVNETPKSEHDRQDVLSTAPSDDAVKAREAALKEAAKVLHDWQDDLIARQMRETAITVGMSADVVLALLTKEARS